MEEGDGVIFQGDGLKSVKYTDMPPFLSGHQTFSESGSFEMFSKYFFLPHAIFFGLVLFYLTLTLFFLYLIF